MRRVVRFMAVVATAGLGLVGPEPALAQRVLFGGSGAFADAPDYPDLAGFSAGQFTFAASLPAAPTPTLADDGVFALSGVTMSFAQGGTRAAISGTFDGFTSGDGGGFDFQTGTSGDDLLDATGPQLFSGPTSAPVLAPGSWVPANGAFGVGTVWSYFVLSQVTLVGSSTFDGAPAVAALLGLAPAPFTFSAVLLAAPTPDFDDDARFGLEDVTFDFVQGSTRTSVTGDLAAFTLDEGGGFALAVGPGKNDIVLSLFGPQLFLGSTGAPLLVPGSSFEGTTVSGAPSAWAITVPRPTAPAVVPEPASLVLLGTGVLALAAATRRRRPGAPPLRAPAASVRRHPGAG